MAVRPRGPGKRRPVWIVGPVGPVMASVYWRPWGRSGTIKWCLRRGRVFMTGNDVRIEWEAMMAKRPAVDQMPKLADLGAEYGSWEKLCPELATWLCDGSYEDGAAKGEVTVTLRRNVTTISATLKIEDGGLCLRASGDTVDDALVALELMLGASQVPWEVDPYPLGGNKKNRKRGG